MAWNHVFAWGSVLLALLLSLPPACASNASLSDLESAISSFEDSRISVADLAFYLATHGFDASPKGSFVEVDLGGRVYRLAPNGPADGLCTIVT